MYVIERGLFSILTRERGALQREERSKAFDSFKIKFTFIVGKNTSPCRYQINFDWFQYLQHSQHNECSNILSSFLSFEWYTLIHFFLFYLLEATIMINATNYSYIKLWQSWRGKTRGHCVIMTNAKCISTKGYIIKEKFIEKKKGYWWVYFKIELALLRLWLRRKLLTVWFCLKMYPDFDHQTRANDKALSDLHQ